MYRSEAAGEKLMDTTTAKGFQLLEKLALSDTPRGISELSREMDLTKSNVQRILLTLGTLGYVDKEPQTSRYFATLKMWEFGNRVLQRGPIVRACANALKTLRSETQETTALCLLDGLDVVYVDKIESENPIRLSCPVGARLPAYATATGRVIAAFRPAEAVDAIVERYRANVSDGKMNLIERFAAIRANGYETSEGGFRMGINSVAVPIQEANGSVVASVAVTGPKERLTPQRLVELSEKLLDAAARVSNSLGYVGREN
jgi:IclR family KDG regulon transcriptional repressor